MQQIEILSDIKYIEEKSDPSTPLFLFAYNISIINKTKSSVQLLNRHWKITDGNGMINTVNGKGVIGLQPIISSNEKFEYSSFCPLSTEFGIMSGWYEMKDEHELLFKVKIPTINLYTPSAKN
tara:strand:+ start:968 stop:1336 length:369 start_codon:yes stop_codon:yes gene_type:complete